MFDINALSKLTDAIPEDVKEKVTEAMKQQLTNRFSGQASGTAATPSVDAGQPNETAAMKVDESEESELDEENKADPASLGRLCSSVSGFRTSKMDATELVEQR